MVQGGAMLRYVRATKWFRIHAMVDAVALGGRHSRGADYRRSFRLGSLPEKHQANADIFRCQVGKRRIWQIKNVGQGVAAYVRVHDFASDKKTIVNKVRTYPIGPTDAPRELIWATAGGKLDALYTDVYGRRWYQTICDENENQFRRIRWSFGRRPKIAALRQYPTEIDAILEYEKNAPETE
jgi:hypothetical protein